MINLQTLTSSEREGLVENIAKALIGAQDFLQERAIKLFSQVDPNYGNGIKHVLCQLKGTPNGDIPKPKL